jgi:hypothetical protein
MNVFKLADLALNLLNTALVARPLASVLGECERKPSVFRLQKPWLLSDFYLALPQRFSCRVFRSPIQT